MSKEKWPEPSQKQSEASKPFSAMSTEELLEFLEEEESK